MVCVDLGVDRSRKVNGRRLADLVAARSTASRAGVA